VRGVSSPLRRARRFGAPSFALLVALAGCAAEGPATRSSRAASSEASLPPGARILTALRGAQLVALRTIDEAPQGGDGPSTLDLAVVRHDRVVPVALPSPAIDAVAWGDGAAVRSADGTLRRVTAEGRAVLVAREVVDRPAVDATGTRLAVVVRDGTLSVALHLLEGGRTFTLARDLPAAGALRFSPDAGHLVYVGRSPGGVAGLHVVAVPAERGVDSNPTLPAQDAIPRCLTNCTIITGTLAENPFLPLPAGASALRFEGDVLVYGGTRTVYRGAGE
jgi:hypothetical protein